MILGRNHAILENNLTFIKAYPVRKEKGFCMKKIEKVSLIGLGAMGAFFAPALYKTLGDNFRVIADGSRKERLETKGVTINGVNYKFPIVTPDAAKDPADLVIIAVKGYNLEQAILDIRGQIGSDTLILSVLNGVDSEQKVIEAYGEKQVLYSFMRISIVMKDGIADFNPEKGQVHFGEKRNKVYSERVLAVKELMERSNIRYIIEEDMLYGIWNKFMCNVGENLTCALLGVPFGAFRDSEHANAIRKGAMREVIRIANASGILLSEEDIERQEATIKVLPYENKPSTLQDLEISRRTEIDMFAGTVVRLGREFGIETPICEMFLHGIHVLEEKNEGTIQNAPY